MFLVPFALMGRALCRMWNGKHQITMLTQPATTSHLDDGSRVELCVYISIYTYICICTLYNILQYYTIYRFSGAPDPNQYAKLVPVQKQSFVAFADPREFIKQKCTTLECTRPAGIWQRSLQGSNQLSNRTKC